MTIFEKDPQAVLDYTVDWASWLGDTDLIVTSTWTVPSGITKDSSTQTGTSTTIWLSAGTAGSSYEIVNSIITAAGRHQDRTIGIKMMEQ